MEVTQESGEGNWLLTDHSANVAVQFADRYATAVAAQAYRIREPYDQFERVPDCFLQVNAIHNVLRAAEMAKRAVSSSAAKRVIQEVTSTFLGPVVVQQTGLAPHGGSTGIRDGGAMSPKPQFR